MKAEHKISKSSFWANLFKTSANTNDLYNIFKNTPLFANLSRTNIKNLFELLHHRSYKGDEYIFHQGDPGNTFYIIVEGAISIIQSSEEDVELLTTELTTGDFFGELSLMDNNIRSASAIAMCNSKLAVIFKPDLDAFMKKNPIAGVEIMKNMAKILSTRLKNLNKDFTKLLDKYNENVGRN